MWHEIQMDSFYCFNRCFWSYCARLISACNSKEKCLRNQNIKYVLIRWSTGETWLNWCALGTHGVKWSGQEPGVTSKKHISELLDTSVLLWCYCCGDRSDMCVQLSGMGECGPLCPGQITEPQWWRRVLVSGSWSNRFGLAVILQLY